MTAMRDEADRAAAQHRRLRHGHDLARRAAAGQARRGARRRLLADHAVGARPRRRTRTASTPRCGRCATAACASPASRCCATSRACRATCTSTRSTSPSRCSRCAPRSASKVLLVCSSTSDARHRRPRRARARPAQARDAGGAARHQASPTKGLSWGRTINEFTDAWDIVCRADAPNLGIGIDSFHIFATKTSLDDLDLLDPGQDLPGAAGRLHVAGNPHGRGAHRDRAPLPRLPGRGRAQRRAGRAGDAARRASATAATTASRSSTTTTSRCRWPRSRRAPAAPRSGWARTCCGEPCRCPTGSAYAEARHSAGAECDLLRPAQQNGIRAFGPRRQGLRNRRANRSRSANAWPPSTRPRSRSRRAVRS